MSIDLRSIEATGTPLIRPEQVPALQARVETIIPEPAQVAESPLWRGGSLWWCDIPAGLVWRLGTGGPEAVLRAPVPVSAMCAETGGGLVLAAGDGLHLVGGAAGETWPGHVLGCPEQMPNRFNDMAAAPDGSLWVGRLGAPEAPGTGVLLHAGPAAHGMLAFTEEVTGVGLPNGISWQGQDLLLVDSGTGVIWRCELTGGHVTSAHAWARFAGATPDGWCQDAEGCRWVAMWGGGCLLRLDPSGRPLARIDLPVATPTCPAFGPQESTTLWVTTESHPGPEPSVLRVEVPIPGRPPPQAALA